MTKLFQSGRTQNRLPQYLALFLVAGLVIIPLYATAVGGLKSLGEFAQIRSVCPALGFGRTIGTCSPIRGSGNCSSILR